jgi:hypothetical protein
MKMLEKIPGMDARQLAELEANAKRVQTTENPKRKAEAATILSAIRAERQAREQAYLEGTRLHLESVRDMVKDFTLFDRVALAFQEMPPTSDEAAALRAIALHPGKDFHFLATCLGKRDGGYMNLAVGTLCSNRKAYLGPPPSQLRDKTKPLWSALIIDFIEHRQPDGSEWSGWALKPEAEAALRRLGII